MPIADPIPPRELPAVSSELEDDDVLSLAQLLEDQAIALQDEGYRSVLPLAVSARFFLSEIALAQTENGFTRFPLLLPFQRPGQHA
jgi:hypothetical protein